MIARHSITLFRSVEALTNNEVRISVTASAVLDVVTLEMITSKLRQVRATITTCSALPNHEENAAAVSTARASMDVEVLKRLEHNDVGVTAGLLLRQFSIAIKTQQAGNCYEYSLLMQFLLSKSSLRSEIF
jgi:hypothetical protein